MGLLMSDRFEVVRQPGPYYLLWDSVEETWVYLETGPWKTRTLDHANAKAVELNAGKGV